MTGSAEIFDYVIVGAGAAGSVLANRLSAADVTVCVLEAGPSDNHPFLHIPAGFIKVIFDPRFAWQYDTEPSDMLHGRSIPIPQGRTLGGSSSVNGLVFNRGQHEDYDLWEQLGNPGWSFRDVLPYFKALERRIGGEDEYRGRQGSLAVTDPDWQHPICEAFIEGAQEMGLPRAPDYNGACQLGVGYFQRTIKNGMRVSASKAFLKPLKKEKNLHIKTNAQATKIIFEDKQAVGVEYTYSNQPSKRLRVKANKEVIIACGAINTPRLLQLSGLGPADLLRRHGVTVVKNLPGVGENLSDHYSVRVVAKVRNVQTINELTTGIELWRQVFNWILKRPSVLSLSPSVVHWFCKSQPSVPRADLQGVFTPASYKEGYVGRLDDYPGMTAGVWQHRPKSRGHVRIASSDPYAKPIIQPNYLHHHEDQTVLVRGIQMARNLLKSDALSPFYDTEVFPGSDCQTEDELLDFAKRYGVSSYHVNGTARMGQKNDRYAVVDEKLKVHGISRLRIVDSSVMPSIVSGNTCAASMMIGYKAADLIFE